MQPSILRETLGEEAFTALWAEGWAMSMEEAIAYALENRVIIELEETP